MNLSDDQFLRASLAVFFGYVLLDAVLADYLAPAACSLVAGLIGAAFMVPLLAIRFRQLGFNRAWGLLGLLLPCGFMVALGLYFFGDELERPAKSGTE